MLSARSSANSEPETKRLVAAIPRPSSSYDPVQVHVDPVAFDADVIYGLAKVLGVELDSQLNIQWIVRDCLLRLQEEQWVVQVISTGSNSGILLKHERTGEERGTNEIVEIHRQLAERIKYDLKILEAARLDPIYKVKEAVYNPFLCVKECTRACSPELVNLIFQLLGIDLCQELYLVQVVKDQIEGSFLDMMDAGGSHLITVDTCIEMEEFVVRIALERVRFIRSTTEAGLVFCVNCKLLLADGICAACADCLCSACQVALHKHGSRLDHQFVFFEQCVCAECEEQAAVVRCVDCCDLFCRKCFRATHKVGLRTSHSVQLPMTAICYHCRCAEASVACKPCGELFCGKCSDRIHIRSSSNHTLSSVRKACYSRKAFSTNFESLLAIVQQREQMAWSGWLEFFDENGRVEWYNFLTKNRQKNPPTVVEEENTAWVAATRLAHVRASFAVPEKRRLQM